MRISLKNQNKITDFILRNEMIMNERKENGIKIKKKINFSYLKMSSANVILFFLFAELRTFASGFFHASIYALAQCLMIKNTGCGHKWLCSRLWAQITGFKVVVSNDWFQKEVGTNDCSN